MKTLRKNYLLIFIVTLVCGISSFENQGSMFTSPSDYMIKIENSTKIASALIEIIPSKKIQKQTPMLAIVIPIIVIMFLSLLIYRNRKMMSVYLSHYNSTNLFSTRNYVGYSLRSDQTYLL